MKITYYNDKEKHIESVIFDTLAGLLYIVKIKQDGTFECVCEDKSVLCEMKKENLFSFDDVYSLIRLANDVDDGNAIALAHAIKSIHGKINVFDFPQIPAKDAAEISHIFESVNNQYNEFVIVQFKKDFRDYAKGTFHLAKRCVHEELVKVQHGEHWWCYVPDEYLVK